MTKDKKSVSKVMMVALGRGFYGSKRIREGEVFEFTGIPGKWMAPVGIPAKVEKPKKDKGPDTFSGLQKAAIADEKQNEA